MIHSPLVTSSFLCGEAIAPGTPVSTRNRFEICLVVCLLPIGSMYAIYGNIYHQYTPNASIYTIHGWILWIMVVKTSQITNGTQMETEMVGTGEVSLKNSRSHRFGIPHTHQLLTHLISWPGTIVRKRLGRRGSERNNDFFFNDWIIKHLKINIFQTLKTLFFKYLRIKAVSLESF